MSTLVVVLAVIGSTLFTVSAVAVCSAVVIRSFNQFFSIQVLEDTDENELDDTEEESEYTLESLMQQGNNPAFMAISLHELFRTFRAAGFTRDESYGLVQNALYASIISQSEE